MSRLAYIGRPWVAFDATKRQHREWYTEFQRKGTWGHCPVRFIIDNEAQTNLVTVIQQKLVSYYVGKEFSKAK